MDKLILGIILAAITLVAIVAAFYIFVLIGSILLGVVGFALVKTKYPLINPEANLFYAIIYALLWSLVIVIGLLISSQLLHETLFGTLVVNNPYPTRFHGLAWMGSLLKGAAPAMIEFPLILLVSTYTSRSFLAQRNIRWAIAVVSAAASVILLLSPSLVIAELKGSSFFTVAIEQIKDTMTFPFYLYEEMKRDMWFPVAHIHALFMQSEGNLFSLLPFLSKFLWIYSIIQFALGTILWGSKHEINQSINSAAQNKNFGNVSLIFLYLLALPAIGGLTMFVCMNWLYEQERIYRGHYPGVGVNAIALAVQLINIGAMFAMIIGIPWLFIRLIRALWNARPGAPSDALDPIWTPRFPRLPGKDDLKNYLFNTVILGILYLAPPLVAHMLPTARPTGYDSLWYPVVNWLTFFAVAEFQHVLATAFGCFVLMIIIITNFNPPR